MGAAGARPAACFFAQAGAEADAEPGAAAANADRTPSRSRYTFCVSTNLCIGLTYYKAPICHGGELLLGGLAIGLLAAQAMIQHWLDYRCLQKYRCMPSITNSDPQVAQLAWAMSFYSMCWKACMSLTSCLSLAAPQVP